MLISHLKADFMEMPRRMMLPHVVALLVKCTVPSHVPLRQLCQAVLALPVETLQMTLHGSIVIDVLSDWLWCLDGGVWFPEAFSVATKAFMSRSSDDDSVLQPNMLALLACLFAQHEPIPAELLDVMVAPFQAGSHHFVLMCTC